LFKVQELEQTEAKICTFAVHRKKMRVTVKMSVAGQYFDVPFKFQGHENSKGLTRFQFQATSGVIFTAMRTSGAQVMQQDHQQVKTYIYSTSS